MVYRHQSSYENVPGYEGRLTVLMKLSLDASAIQGQEEGCYTHHFGEHCGGLLVCWLGTVDCLITSVLIRLEHFLCVFSASCSRYRCRRSMDFNLVRCVWSRENTLLCNSSDFVASIIFSKFCRLEFFTVFQSFKSSICHLHKYLQVRILQITSAPQQFRVK